VAWKSLEFSLEETIILEQILELIILSYSYTFQALEKLEKRKKDK